MLWFNFILGLNFISLCFKLIIIDYHTPKQRKIKFKPRIKLNHNIDTWSEWRDQTLCRVITFKGLTLSALRMISIKFLLIISMLYKTDWSGELRACSGKINLIDTSTNSPHCFYWKYIGTRYEINNFDIRVQRVKIITSKSGWLWVVIVHKKSQLWGFD